MLVTFDAWSMPVLTRIPKERTMTTYEFDVVLKGVSELADDQVEALFDAGCDDGTPVSRDGLAWIHFDRTALSLEEAIRSAVAQVQSVGFTAWKVELDASSAVTLPVAR
jgi:hypothetical protein